MQNAGPNPLTHAQLFQQLAGDWQLKRVLHSTSPTLPSGILRGKARFVPQAPSAPGYQKEYQYQEDGHLRTKNNTHFDSQQIYIYRLAIQPEIISVWPTDRDHQALTEPLHILNTITLQPNMSHYYIIQAPPHHCKQDRYQLEYQFYVTNTQLKHWVTTYDVTGPKKDYRIENYYTRFAYQQVESF